MTPSTRPRHPGVEFEIANADAVAMRMITAPRSFDVIAAENLLGDMLSDMGAGLMGGLGPPSSGNIGADHAVFEPVHGSAPDIAGRGIANPAAFLLSAAMCAEHLADKVEASQASPAVECGAGSEAGSKSEAATEVDGEPRRRPSERADRLRSAVIRRCAITHPRPRRHQHHGGIRGCGGRAGRRDVVKQPPSPATNSPGMS